jgi:hypothetical protein
LPQDGGGSRPFNHQEGLAKMLAHQLRSHTVLPVLTVMSDDSVLEVDLNGVLFHVPRDAIAVERR